MSTDRTPNVDALTEILQQITDGEGIAPWGLDRVARELASRGVLVPSAITDEEGWTVSRASLLSDHVADNLRTNLERIAKGNGLANLPPHA